MQRILRTTAPTAVILIRLMVGAVFLSEGIQKFLFPDAVGAGRFEKIGIPSPEIVAPFVACFEISCGILVLLGLLTRLAVIPLIVIMLTAMVTTKFDIFMESGFWKMAHEARTDWSMLLGSIFLLIVGAGPWSLDARFASRGPEADGSRSRTAAVPWKNIWRAARRSKDESDLFRPRRRIYRVVTDLRCSS